ncbi:MAG: ferrous iron transport protein A [Bacilli bacterium]|nr:ferrous iron transport protein A [Bacilli bacterium]
MKKILTLDKIKVGQTAKILEINSNYNLKRRLLDLGIVKDSDIKCEFKSPFNDPTAYFIKGTTIALREEDAINIRVSIDE